MTLCSLVRPLHDAIKSGDVTNVKALLDVCTSDINAVNGGHTAVTCALENCVDDVIPRLLLKHPQFDPQVRNSHQRTPLFEAAKLGRDVMVTWLLGMGAQVDAGDRRGMTPLSISAVYNR